MAEGDFGSVIDTEQLNSLSSNYSSVIKIAENVYCMVMRKNVSGQYSLYFQTFSVDESKNITAIDFTGISDLAYDSWYPRICHVRDNIYAVASNYKPSTYYYGYITTISISPTGDLDYITDYLFDFPLDSAPYYGQLRYCNITKISDGIIAVSYLKVPKAGDAYEIYIKTFSINSSGAVTSNIDTSLVETYFDPATVLAQPVLVRSRGNVYVIFYYDAALSAVMAKSYTITSAGQISALAIDTLTVDEAMTQSLTSAIYVDEGIVAVNAGIGNYDRIRTVGIGSGGSLSNLGYLDFINKTDSFLERLYKNIFISATESTSDSTGYVYSFSISTDGKTITQIDSLQFITATVGTGTSVSVDYENDYIVAVCDKGYPFAVTISMALTASEVEVETKPATNVTQSSVRLNGYLENDGGESCACYFEWGTSTSYGNTTEPTYQKTGEVFSSFVTNITILPGVIYHFRAVAYNSYDIDYGEDRTFYISEEYEGTLETRVTGLTHRFGPGHYSLEIFLGGLTTYWNLVDYSKKPLPAVPSEQNWLGPFYEITEDGMRFFWLLPDGTKQYILT